MISVEEAQSIVAKTSIQPKIISHSVDSSLCGMTLAEDIIAPMALPTILTVCNGWLCRSVS